jgi:hypothetical protein
MQTHVSPDALTQFRTLLLSSESRHDAKDLVCLNHNNLSAGAVNVDPFLGPKDGTNIIFQLECRWCSHHQGNAAAKTKLMNLSEFMLHTQHEHGTHFLDQAMQDLLEQLGDRLSHNKFVGHDGGQRWRAACRLCECSFPTTKALDLHELFHFLGLDCEGGDNVASSKGFWEQSHARKEEGEDFFFSERRSSESPSVNSHYSLFVPPIFHGCYKRSDE